MKLAAGFAVLLLAASHLSAQDAAAPPAYRLVASYDRPGVPIPHWQVTLSPRGTAEYVGAPSKGPDPGAIAFPVSVAGRDRLRDLLDRSDGMQPCETRSKGIARMGDKVLEYTPAGGAAQRCAFNFTDNKPLAQAFDYLFAMVETVQAGVEIERLHRFDRLGLDPVLIRLATEARDGKAVELGAIRPTLESLLTDTAVLDRVRARAQQLLDLASLEDSGKAPRH